MSDRYQAFSHSRVGKLVTKNLGLPAPLTLERYQPGQPVVDGTILLGGAPGGEALDAVTAVLKPLGGKFLTYSGDAATTAAAAAGLNVATYLPPATRDAEQQKFKAVVYDATGITDTAGLGDLQRFFTPAIRGISSCGRVVVIGRVPGQAASARIAQRALEGFTRSLAKEVGNGSTVQLVQIAPPSLSQKMAADRIGATLRFLLSPKSAYVSGQVVRIGVDAPEAADTDTPRSWETPLAGKVALVTGASRGIGEAIASTLARDGAKVIGLDVPAMATELEAVMARIGGESLTLDITADQAPAQIATYLSERHEGVDVVVHNAGITRDKKLANMKDGIWKSVIAVNLTAPERITAELLDQKLIRAGGRVVGVSSIAGIAGNGGQTNYGASKAGVIGFVDATAPVAAEQGVTVNAVAPGFIETQMTAKIPFAIREAGRRMNSMQQGGQPVDVAETVAWFASPGSGGVSGNVVRVCGQSLLGA